MTSMSWRSLYLARFGLGDSQSIQIDLSYYFVAKMAEISHGEQVG